MNKRFEKDIKYYILKNKDKSVLRFKYEKTIDKNKFLEYASYKIKNVEIIEPSLLPKSYENIKDSKTLKDFIERRKIPKNRKNMQEVMNHQIKNIEVNSNDFMNYIDISFGLSLTDSYWIVPEDKDYKWEDYNLYTNKFNEILSLIAFGEKGELANSQGEIRISPEYTTDGMLAKCWTVIENEIVLLKKSSEHYKKEAYSEYYMSQVASLMNLEHIDYDLIEFHKNIVSKCSLFTTEEVGFTPMYLCLEKKDLTIKPVKLLEKISEVVGDEFLEDIMVFDSIIYNTDRHLGNFGMLINNNTGEYIKPAPIFDNGNSILTLIDSGNIEEIIGRYTSKQEIDFNTLGRGFVKERHRKGLEKLIDFKFIRHEKYNLDEDLLIKAEEFIRLRAKYILEKLDEK